MVSLSMHGLQFYFYFLKSLVGLYVCSDPETREQVKFDVAKILVKTKYCLVLNQMFNVEINDKNYRVKLVKDMHVPKRIFIPKEPRVENFEEESSWCSEEEDNVWDQNIMETEEA